MSVFNELLAVSLVARSAPTAPSPRQERRGPEGDTFERPPGVSVVICCHNGARRLPETLAHLSCQVSDGGRAWEVVIIDNASTDETASVARACWPAAHPVPLRIVSEPALGLVHARARGIAESRYSLISFVDDDNLVAENWVDTVFRVMGAHPDAGACAGRTVAAHEAEPPNWFGAFQEHFACGDKGVLAMDVGAQDRTLWGAGLTIRWDAWRALVAAGYRPWVAGRQGKALLSGEDTELCLALRLAGWKLWYEPSLTLRHFMPQGRVRWRYLRQMQRGFGRALPYTDLYLQQLHPKPVQRRSGALLRAVARLCVLTLRRPWLLVGVAPEGDDVTLAWERSLGRVTTLAVDHSRHEQARSAVAQLHRRLLAPQND